MDRRLSIASSRASARASSSAEGHEYGATSARASRGNTQYVSEYQKNFRPIGDYVYQNGIYVVAGATEDPLVADGLAAFREHLVATRRAAVECRNRAHRHLLIEQHKCGPSGEASLSRSTQSVSTGVDADSVCDKNGPLSSEPTIEDLAENDEEEPWVLIDMPRETVQRVKEVPRLNVRKAQEMGSLSDRQIPVERGRSLSARKDTKISEVVERERKRQLALFKKEMREQPEREGLV